MRLDCCYSARNLIRSDVDQFSSIDMQVNNAGWHKDCSVLGSNEGDWERALRRLRRSAWSCWIRLGGRTGAVGVWTVSLGQFWESNVLQVTLTAA
jgi:hypothetical protein